MRRDIPAGRLREMIDELVKDYGRFGPQNDVLGHPAMAHVIPYAFFLQALRVLPHLRLPRSQRRGASSCPVRDLLHQAP